MSEQHNDKREPLYLTLAIRALNEVKAWRDSDGNESFPHELREKIDALLIAYELRRHSTLEERSRQALGDPRRSFQDLAAASSTPSANAASVPCVSDEQLQDTYASVCAIEGHMAGLRAIVQAVEDGRIAFERTNPSAIASRTTFDVVREYEKLAGYRVDRSGRLHQYRMSAGSAKAEWLRTLEQMIRADERAALETNKGTNYVCDHDTSPKRVEFANGRVVTMIGKGHLSVGWKNDEV